MNNESQNKLPNEGEEFENKVVQDNAVEKEIETQEPVQQQPTPEPTIEPEPRPEPEQTQQTPPPYNPYFSGEQKHYIPHSYSPNNFGSAPSSFAPQPPAPQKPKKNNGKKGLKVFLSLVCVAMVFILGISVGKYADVILPKITNQGAQSATGEDINVNSGEAIKREDITPDESGRYTPDQVAQLVAPSVVNIRVYSKTDETVGATASGVILNNEGYIITNDHIYSQVQNALFVITLDNGESYKASYVAGDQRSDIALLKFDTIPKNIQGASFADSSEVCAGDEVIAIGSPYGLTSTVTKGIVSYPSRRISFTSSDGTASYSMRVIQTDAALNSGNSGGALVNMYGQVVGISSSKIASTGYEGLCFAIPANDAIKYAKSLAKNFKVVGRARLGITYSEISSADALIKDVPSGLRLQTIDKDCALYGKITNLGENGDIVTHINDKKITDSDVALDIIDDSVAGDTVTLKIYSIETQKTSTYTVKLLESVSSTSYVQVEPTQPNTTHPYNENYDDYFKEFEDYFYGDSDYSDLIPYN